MSRALLDEHGNPVGPPPPPDDEYRVVMLIPAGDDVRTMTMHDLVCLTGFVGRVMPNVRLAIRILRSSLLPQSRQMLLRDACNDARQFTHALWVDSDMRFPPDALARLLAHDKPFVGANYSTRGSPLTTVTFKTLEQVGFADRVFTTPESHGLEAVAGTGLGLFLCQLDPIRQLPDPLFMVGWSPKSMTFSGEDIYFFRQLAKAGFPIYVDHDLSKEVRHVGSFEYTNEMAAEIRGGDV
jgi:hypothetical protein